MLNFREVLGAAPRIQRAVSQLADDGNRKQEFFGGLGKETAWPASTAIATLVSRATLLPLTEIDALEFALYDRAHFFGVVR